MTVKELIEKLSQFDSGLTVTITDGYEGIFYKGEYFIAFVNDEVDGPIVDIGIGGCNG